jgi:hypothetical protein
MPYPNQEIAELRKEGRLEEAYLKAKEFLRESPDDKYLKFSFGWVLHDKIKALKSNTTQNSHEQTQSIAQEIRNLLLEYRGLELERPDLLFSQLLIKIVKVENLEWFSKFMLWAGLDSFRPEDLRKKTGEGETAFPPMIYDVAKKVAKTALDKEHEQQEFAIDLLEKAITEGELDDNERQWLVYRKALLLVELERPEEAQKLLVPIVRKKQSEFWAWSALAKAFEGSNPQMALSLYAKAFLQCKEQKFILKTCEGLCRASVAQDRFDLAKWAVDKAVAVRTENQWRSPQSLRDLLDSDWYGQAEGIENAESVLKSFAEDSDAIVYADCQRFEANYLGAFDSKNGKPMVKFAMRRDPEVEEIVNPSRGLMNGLEFKFGEPVQIGIDESGGWPRVFEAKSRPEGEQFDCLKKQIGIIDHQNKQKGLAWVYISVRESQPLHHKQFSEIQNWAACTCLRILYIKQEYPIHVEKIEFQETDCIKRLKSDISIHDKGFGFVGNSVFVPPKVAQNYEDGQETELVVVMKVKKDVQEVGWEALGSVDDTVIDN